MVGFGFSNNFRLLETTKFFFFLGHFHRLISAWTYVFWLITQENTRKLQYQSPQKKLLLSDSGSRIFVDYLKRPNFSFTLGSLKEFRHMNLCILVDTQENTRKLQYQSPQKKFLRSVSGSRIFFDYSKRPNFSFT